MSVEITRILASKNNGEQGATSAIFDVAAGSSASMVLTIQDGYVFFLLEYGGNVTAADVEVDLRNREGLNLISHPEFPDAFVKFEYTPHIKEYFKNQLSLFVQNNGSATITATLFVEGFLIPQALADKFIQEVQDYVNIPNILRGKA